MKRPIELPTDKDVKILHTFAYMQDNRNRGYFIPANKEDAFKIWAATGRDYIDGEFDDFRVAPAGAITKLIFHSPRSVN